MRNLLFACFAFSAYLLEPAHLLAQDGVGRSFAFLNRAGNARLAGMGGVNVSLADRDLNFFFSNPALAGDTLAGVATASYQFGMADIGQATAAYSHRFKRAGMITFGVQHLRYGKMAGYDATGAPTGEFSAGETVLVVGKSHQVRHFRVGVNLKAAFSNIAGYRASALLVDVGGAFVHPTQELTVALTIANLGFMLGDYSETASTQLPLDVRAGVTFKPEHMPLRFSLTAYNLARTDIIYTDPSGADDVSTFDKVLRRLNFAAEILVHRNVNLLVGYNYLVHQELKLADSGGGAGVSFGFSANIKSFELAFSRSAYVIGNAAYTFTLSKNIDNLLKRR